MSKLNAKQIMHAAPKETEYRMPDGHGLFLRVRPSGAKSWLFCFRLPGDRSLLQMTLGSLNDVSLKGARTLLPELRKLVAQGIDPRNARAAIKTENAQAVTMQSLFDAWMGHLEIANDVTEKWRKRHIARWQLHLQKSLGNLLARDVTRAHLAAALDTMTRKGIKEETRKALTTLNLMLDYGLTRHLVEQNAARMLKPKDFAATANRSRDRVLSLQELRKLWQALDAAVALREGVARTSHMSPVTAIAIKILILTGARRTEVASMEWENLCLKTGVWQLSSDQTKNRLAHKIYLPKLAIDLINELHLLNGQATHVFDTGQGTGHIHSDSLTTALSRLRNTNLNIQKSFLSDVKPFTIHDIRRSAATAWGEHLKIKPHVIERMLNHQPLNKLVAIYQRATYAEEQKNAWHAWGELVEHQIATTPNNIVPIRNVVNT